MNERTRQFAATGLAVLAAGLMLTALFFLASGEHTRAGLSFLVASIVIYYRETSTQ